jgi:hypothetical protein
VAQVLKDKGYKYQYQFCRGQGHSIGNAQAQFLAHALEWVWKGMSPRYQVDGDVVQGVPNRQRPDSAVRSHPIEPSVLHYTPRAPR